MSNELMDSFSLLKSKKRKEKKILVLLRFSTLCLKLIPHSLTFLLSELLCQASYFLIAT
uniref:Uncharacterized protein n=1 Tax=Rhizophora mucronata TaxID=61149 RepID=A0A2P2LZV5_RHIMU